MSSIWMHYGTHLQEMTGRLMEQAAVAKRLHPSMQVCIKPNLVVSRPAKFGATTHPEIVEGIIQFLLRHGVQNIVIAEGAWVGDSTTQAWQNCGYLALQEKYPVKLLDTKQDSTLDRSHNGLDLAVCQAVADSDFLINVPVLKGHCQTGITCCLKNLKGCIPDREKRRYHAIGLHQPIASLNAVLRPHLHIVDGICGDLNFEEGGNPVEQNRILLGYDPVLLDSYCAQLLGFRPLAVRHLELAHQAGLGTLYSDQTPVLELGSQHKPQNTSQPTPRVAQLGRLVAQDGACSACYASLVFALDKLEQPPGASIHIGQGFQGKKLRGIGIGDCTKGAEHHVAGCPPKALDILEQLRSWEISS